MVGRVAAASSRCGGGGRSDGRGKVGEEFVAVERRREVDGTARVEKQQPACAAGEFGRAGCRKDEPSRRAELRAAPCDAAIGRESRAVLVAAADGARAAAELRLPRRLELELAGGAAHAPAIHLAAAARERGP